MISSIRPPVGSVLPDRWAKKEAYPFPDIAEYCWSLSSHKKLYNESRINTKTSTGDAKSVKPTVYEAK